MAIIDNIDFKEKSFKFDNIYNVTRDNSHATLRIAFQIWLLIKIQSTPEQVIELITETPLFEMNENVDKALMIF